MKTFNKNSLATALAFALIGILMGPVAVFAAGPASVNLGSAGNFVILSKTGISTTGSTSVTGDIGVSPITASAITGFALTLPAASAFSTSALVTGKVYASDYANPTPANLTSAVLDMQTAYTDAAGRASTVTELGAGNIGGLTLSAGTYRWGTGVTIPTDVTLTGSANDVWIFQIAQTLTVSSGVKVILSGGAQASNIFWVVGGQTTIGTTAVFNGNILDQTAIVLNTSATLNGRALAQTAVTLDSNAVAMPALVAVVVTPTPTPSPAPSPAPMQSSTPNYTTPTSTTNSNSSSNSASTYTTPQSQTSLDQKATLQAELNQLQAALHSLQVQQGSLPSASSFGQQVKTIATNLSKGSGGSDVIILQQFLISQNKGSAARSLANVGATGYFGVLTRSALAEFQAQAGISPAIGNFGPITRAYVDTNY